MTIARWLPCTLLLVLVAGWPAYSKPPSPTAARTPRGRPATVSFYHGGKPGYVAAQRGLRRAPHRLRKSDKVWIARMDGKGRWQYRVCCFAPLHGRAFDLRREAFARYAHPSRGLARVRWWRSPKRGH